MERRGGRIDVIPGPDTRSDGELRGVLGEATMRDPLNRSLTLGRWWGLTIRVHGSFLIFAVTTFYLSWPSPGGGAAGNMLPVVMMGFLVLFASVLWHELGHLLVARRNHVIARQIVLGPLGGLTNWTRPGDAAVTWRFSLAGPAANLILVLAGVGILWVTVGRPHVLGLINPLGSSWVVAGPSSWEQVLRMAIWINGLLLLLNLLPAYPFDGGRLLSASLLLVSPNLSRRLVAEVVHWAAVVTAALLLVTALLLWKHTADTLFPTWIALVLLAAVLLVGVRRDTWQESAVGTAPRPGGTHRDVDRPIRSAAAVPAAPPWSPHGLEPPDPWSARSEMEEDEQVDEILQRLHRGGMESLDARDRDLLRRASLRYRARRKQP
jgi:stage IV sporulation protein FB